MFLCGGVTAVCRCRLAGAPVMLDFCSATKAFFVSICLGVTHHTYLSTACVPLGSCLILNALHQNKKTFSPRLTVHLYAQIHFTDSLLSPLSYLHSLHCSSAEERKHAAGGPQPRILLCFCGQEIKNAHEPQWQWMLSSKTNCTCWHPNRVPPVVRLNHHWGVVVSQGRFILANENHIYWITLTKEGIKEKLNTHLRLNTVYVSTKLWICWDLFLCSVFCQV